MERVGLGLFHVRVSRVCLSFSDGHVFSRVNERRWNLIRAERKESWSVGVAEGTWLMEIITFNMSDLNVSVWLDPWSWTKLFSGVISHLEWNQKTKKKQKKNQFMIGDGYIIFGRERSAVCYSRRFLAMSFPHLPFWKKRTFSPSYSFGSISPPERSSWTRMSGVCVVWRRKGVLICLRAVSMTLGPESLNFRDCSACELNLSELGGIHACKVGKNYTVAETH